jgi:hypothetical protein
LGVKVLGEQRRNFVDIGRGRDVDSGETVWGLGWSGGGEKGGEGRTELFDYRPVGLTEEVGAVVACSCMLLWTAEVQIYVSSHTLD